MAQKGSKHSACAKCGTTTRVLVVKTSRVVSSVSRIVISCGSIQFMRRVIIMGPMEPNILQLLHDIKLHLKRLHPLLAEDQTSNMLSINSIQKQEDFPKVVMGMIQVLDITILFLIYL